MIQLVMMRQAQSNEGDRAALSGVARALQIARTRLSLGAMQFAYQITVFIHLLGFAALLGGVLVQFRVPDPEVNRAMLVGALIELVTGVGLWVLAVLGSSPVSVPQLVVKLIITVFVAVLVVVNRKYASIPRGLWALIGGLTLANTGIAVFWQ